MARPLRIELSDGVYHVTSRGLERRAIVRDDDDRAKWLELLGKMATQRRWRVLAWALMDNHFHLFLRTPDPDLSAGMHDLNSGYATLFNRRHGRTSVPGTHKSMLGQRVRSIRARCEARVLSETLTPPSPGAILLTMGRRPLAAMQIGVTNRGQVLTLDIAT